MKIGMELSIDVTKIDKTKLFKGKKGTYADLQVFVSDQTDDWGNNGMITQAVTKEERESGIKGAILGNCKIFWNEEGGAASNTPPSQPQPMADDFDDQTIPF